MKVLLLAPASGTSLHRAAALARLGHEVHHVPSRPPMLCGRIANLWTYRTGALGASPLVQAHLERNVGARRFDVALVDGGELLGPEHVRYLRTVSGAVVNFNQDNPYVPAEGLKWKRFVQALPSYDLVVTSQDSGAALAHARGARRVLQVILAADEVVHRPPEPAPARSIPVVFAGTWMPGRGVFLVRLLESGVPVQIFGPRWRKAPEFPILAPVITDGYLDDVSYVRTIASAKIALGLLFAGNRDLHTNRSVEIPAIGTVLCAERTADHSAMYRDGEEAILWSNAEECAALCLELLQDEVRIESIARAGRERALRNGHYNEQLLARILAEATEGGLRPQA